MAPIRPGIRRLLRLAGPQDDQREVDEEIELHLELLTQRLITEGLDPASARAEANRRFGAGHPGRAALYQAARQRNASQRLRDRWEAVIQDLRYAARSLAREPVVTGFIVLTVALAIGVNVLGIGFIDQVLLRGPAHVARPGELVRFFQRTEGPPFGTRTSAWIPYPSFLHLKDELRQLSGIGAYHLSELAVGDDQQRRTMRVSQTLGGYFQLLGTQPLRGRFFSADEDAAGAGPLAVISAAMWQREMASDPKVIGRTIMVGDSPYTIVGVAPDGFTGAGRGRVDLWLLGDSRTARNWNWWIVGRLRPGATAAAVGQAADAIHRRTGQDGPRWTWDATMSAGPLRLGDAGEESIETVMAGWLGGISAIVLLIACANVVNLLLARLARRRRELAVRVALGAGRTRVVRLVLAEGLVLVSVSALASLAVVLLAEPLVRQTFFPEVGWSLSLVDSRTVGLITGIAVMAGVLIGLVPALKAGGMSLTAALRSGARAEGSHSRLRAGLTVVQAGLSVLLLIAAGLFIRSQQRAGAVDLGLNVRQCCHSGIATATFDRQRR